MTNLTEIFRKAKKLVLQDVRDPLEQHIAQPMRQAPGRFIKEIAAPIAKNTPLGRGITMSAEERSQKAQDRYGLDESHPVSKLAEGSGFGSYITENPLALMGMTGGVKEVGGEYIYHGTNEDVLDNIKKEGLQPSRKGSLSLSKDETYARSFAESSKFPKKEGSGAMLRIKADSLKGKTIPSSSGVKGDQLHEILTKETIPPESIEILKDGKWTPLVGTKPPEGVPQKLWEKADNPTYSRVSNIKAMRKGGVTLGNYNPENHAIKVRQDISGDKLDLEGVNVHEVTHAVFEKNPEIAKKWEQIIKGKEVSKYIAKTFIDYSNSDVVSLTLPNKTEYLGVGNETKILHRLPDNVKRFIYNEALAESVRYYVAGGDTSIPDVISKFIKNDLLKVIAPLLGIKLTQKYFR